MADFRVRYNPADFRRDLILGLREFSYDVAATYKQKLIDGDINATGKLINSIRPYSGEIAQDTYVAGIRAESYYIFVENGRRAGAKFPPRQPILKWMQDRNITPQPYTLPSGKSVIPTREQVAFLISRKIAIEGIPAKPFLQQTIEELTVELQAMINDIVGEAITEITLDIGTVKI